MRSKPVPPTLIAALVLPASLAMAQTNDDFSARLDKLWNFGKVEESQARFRSEFERHPKDSREALETQTQPARARRPAAYAEGKIP